MYWRSENDRKDQSVNNTEEEVNSEENVETQNVDNSQDSVENTDNSEVKEDHLQEDSQEEVQAEDVDPKDEKIQELEKLANDNEEKYLRLYAEFENYKRRIQNENQINKTYQAQGVLTDILPSIDNIERALQIEGDDESFKSLQKGVQMVHESLLRALKIMVLKKLKLKVKNLTLIFIKRWFKMIILILNRGNHSRTSKRLQTKRSRLETINGKSKSIN